MKKDLWKKTFWKIWVGQAFSIISSSIVQYAFIWYLTDKTGSAFILSMAGIVAFLPQGILGFFTGSFIDKNDRKKIMIVSDTGIAIVSFIVFIVALFMEVPIWLIFVILAIRSVGSAFHGPAMQASIPLLVPGEELLKYSGYGQMIQSVGLILSPALAALLYSFVSLGNIMLFDVVGALIAVFMLAISKIPKLKNISDTKVNIIKDTKEAFKIINKVKPVKTLFVISIFFNILFMPVNSLFPLFTKNYFGGGTFHLGAVETGFAVGMLAGSFLISQLKIFNNKRRNIIISMIVISATTFLSGILPTNFFYVFLVLCIIMGLSAPIFNATTMTIMGEEIDENYLGRVYAAAMSVSVLVMPIGLFLGGLFAEQIGLNIWFAVTGLLMGVVGIFMIVDKGLKMIKSDKSKETN